MFNIVFQEEIFVMLYRKIGGISTPVSAIGMGCWNIGNQWGEMTDAQAVDIIHAAYDNGITLFDTAESYGIPNGLSELRLRKGLKGIRDQVVIVSKIAHWGNRTGQGVPKTTIDMIRLCGHASIGRLGVDAIDVMLCHEENIQNPEIYIEGFRALRAEGFIREYGVSTSNLEVLKHFYAVSGGECTVVETDYSLLNDAAETNGFFAFCQEKKITVLTRGPLAKGLLSGRYNRDSVFTDAVRSVWNKDGAQRAQYELLMDKLDQVQEKLREQDQLDLPTYALRYILSQPVAPIAIPGATSVAQVIANARAGERMLDAVQLAFASK